MNHAVDIIIILISYNVKPLTHISFPLSSVIAHMHNNYYNNNKYSTFLINGS